MHDRVAVIMGRPALRGRATAQEGEAYAALLLALPDQQGKLRMNLTVVLPYFTSRKQCYFKASLLHRFKTSLTQIKGRCRLGIFGQPVNGERRFKDERRWYVGRPSDGKAGTGLWATPVLE